MLKAHLAFLYSPIGFETNLADMQNGSFAFVSVKVLKAERVKNKFYLNFSEDWGADFTVAIAAHDLKNFRKNNVDPVDL